MAEESLVDLQLDDEAVKRFLNTLQTKHDQIKGRAAAYIDSVSVFVFQDVMDHFKNESGSEGQWKSWSKIYADHMQKIGKSGNKILQDSGRLRQTFHPGMYRGMPAGIQWYNPAKTDSGFPYAYAHDEGGPKLPKRDFMWLSESILEKISEATLAFLVPEDA